MPIFAWEARSSADGAGETRRGELSAASEVQVIEALRRQGMRVVRVERRSLRAGGRPVSAADPAALATALRTLIALRAAGLGASEALELASRRGIGEVARALRASHLAVESGAGLGEALGGHPAAFGALGARALAAADPRGALDSTLAGLCDLLDGAVRVRREARRIAARPLIAAVALLGWFAALGAAVAPAAATVYARLEIDPTGPAARLVAAAPYLALGTSLVAALLALTSLALAVLASRRSRAVAPSDGLGRAIRGLALARFARALALLLGAEVPRQTALELAAWEADDRALTDAALRARVGLSQGDDLGDALTAAELPRTLTRAVQAAGRGGDIPATLRRLADIDEAEALRWLSVRSWRIAQVLWILLVGTVVAAGATLAAPLLR